MFRRHFFLILFLSIARSAFSTTIELVPNPNSQIGTLAAATGSTDNYA